ncbi:heat stress transcription factor B-4-like protein [Tanacetum coccineum]
MPDCILTPPTDESVITYTQLSGVHRVDTQSRVLPTIQSQFSDINLSFISQQATASQVIDDVMRQLSFYETELDGEAGFADVARSGVDSSRLSHDESFGVDDLDLNLHKEPDVNLNVSQVETQSELPVSEEPDVGHTQEPILAEVSTQEPIVAEVITQEPIVAEVSTEAPIVEEVGTQEFSVEDVVIEDYVSSREDGEDAEQGIDNAYETEYDVQSSEDAGTDDDDDVDEDFLVDKENEIVEPDVEVHLFGISMDLPFDNIGITNLVPDDVLEGEDVDVVNADGFDSDPGNDEEINYRKRRNLLLQKEAKDRVYLHSIESRMNLKLYKNDSVRIRARCEGKVPVFTIQASPSFFDAHDKGDLCPWVLYVEKYKFTQNWVVKTNKDTHTCLQSREIKHCTYKFLSEKIFEQVRVNPDIPVKVVQDQLQRELEVQISMSKAFRAKAKAEREIRGHHVLQHSMLRDYVVELQSTNPNTTVKIAVERNTDPSLPTRVFQRIYVCLGALKLGFRACRRDLLGLDGAFMKGSFPGQVLVAVGLDSNNGIYPLAYVLVEAETKSSWCWFLQCLGDDIDLHPNSNFTFISDRQNVSIMLD